MAIPDVGVGDETEVEVAMEDAGEETGVVKAVIAAGSAEDDDVIEAKKVPVLKMGTVDADVIVQMGAVGEMEAVEDDETEMATEAKKIVEENAIPPRMMIQMETGDPLAAHIPKTLTIQMKKTEHRFSTTLIQRLCFLHAGASKLKSF